MNRVLARFKRGEDRVKLLRDLDPDYYYVVTDLIVGGAATKVERLKTLGYPLVMELYEAHGYRRLELCPACQGDGVRWYLDGAGDADRGVCETCQGEGGKLPGWKGCDALDAFMEAGDQAAEWRGDRKEEP